MYVAMTRARSSLHLIAAPQRQATGEARLVADSPLGSLWPALQVDFDAAAAASAVAIETNNVAPQGFPLAAAAPGPSLLRRLPAEWSRPVVAPNLVVEGLNVATYSATSAPEFLWVGETARHIGSVVHAVFDNWLQLTALPTIDTLPLQREIWRRALRNLGVAASEIDVAARRVEEILARTLNDPRGRWALDPKQAESRSEWALTGLVAGRLTQAVVDRCFRDTDGTRWIIDYKTGSHEGGDLDAFLASERERYRPQLQRYRELLPRTAGEVVRSALYFPMLGRFEELQF